MPVILKPGYDPTLEANEVAEQFRARCAMLESELAKRHSPPCASWWDDPCTCGIDEILNR